MNVPNNLKYTKDHEWLKVEGNTGFVGITDFAQSELGDIVFVDIAADVNEISAGNSFGTIEAVKTVSELFAPCDGKVLEINPKLQDEPQLINSDAYGDGWILKIEIANSAQVNELLSDEDYSKLIS
ncbi:MAG: glycine cleavage system protein H [Ignavibacteriales bacterium CG_4_9_14_3_um_filter_34_10]|nr:MAG: glycine cleavage system protein H [Ignavibacteriales bacterium CG_4_9_14_3_um_filter_34_10]